MVEAFDINDRIPVSCLCGTKRGSQHLIISLRHPSNSCHPTVKFTADGQDWALVILGWVIYSMCNIGAPEESSQGVITV